MSEWGVNPLIGAGGRRGKYAHRRSTRRFMNVPAIEPPVGGKGI